MRATTLLATLATVASASPAQMEQRMSMHIDAVENYDWNLTAWSAGCQRAGCYYDFNISAEATNDYPARPAFFAYCVGFGEGSPYNTCTLMDNSTVARRVAAALQPATRTNTSVTAHIKVSFQYTDLETPTTWWNFTGTGDARYNQFVEPEMNFTIKPDTIIGVA